MRASVVGSGDAGAPRPPEPFVGDLDLRLGDCLDVLAGLADASVDAVITDPPYGINFMGKAWDGADIERQAQQELEAEQVRRRGGRGVFRLTGSPDSRERQLIARTGSAYATKAGAAGSYDFTIRGNRAFQAWCEQWGAQLLRVMKPGGHALVFGGTRTHHRLTCALEEVGFEIRDELVWLFGSGFPKSLDVAKAIDKAQGVEGTYGEPKSARSALNIEGRADAASRNHGWDRPWKDDPEAVERTSRLYEPGSDDARHWQGWGTALKPAHEPIVVARKPLVGTVAGNVLAHGVGALNVDGCRIGYEPNPRHAKGGSYARRDNKSAIFGAALDQSTKPHEGGRWPANVVLDEEAAQQIDEQTGELHSQDPATRNSGRKPGWSPSGTERPWLEKSNPNGGDSGGASRFFYVAKASRAERNAGLDGFEERMPHASLSSGHEHRDGRAWDVPGSHSTARANHHPTVKPIALMRWLVRLVTPPGGLILDPFLGSGTTGIAAALEGFRFLGVEREPDYLAIAEARIRFWAEHGQDGLRIISERDAAEQKRAEIAAAGQLDLLAEGAA